MKIDNQRIGRPIRRVIVDNDANTDQKFSVFTVYRRAGFRRVKKRGYEQAWRFGTRSGFSARAVNATANAVGASESGCYLLKDLLADR
jgi:hypothetical protein